MKMKMFDGKELPQELLFTTRKKNMSKQFENNMSTDIKLSRTQISKIFQTGGFLGTLLSKIVERLMKVAVLLAKMFNYH